MSLTSYRAAPPRVKSMSDYNFGIVSEEVPCAWKTWQRPTLPGLKAQYHQRWGLSRPSSGWDRVQILRYNHQIIETDDRNTMKVGQKGHGTQIPLSL